MLSVGGRLTTEAVLIDFSFLFLNWHTYCILWLFSKKETGKFFGQYNIAKTSVLILYIVTLIEYTVITILDMSYVLLFPGLNECCITVKYLHLII